MMRSFYQSIAGMKAMTDGISVTGNNIANSKTTAFKSSSANFEDLFYQSYRTASAPSNNLAGQNPIEIGNGVKMKGVSVDLNQGTIVYTGKKTDVAINGDGYFVVGDGNGNNKKFTRDGSFGLSTDYKLATATGEYVMGWNVDASTGRINTTAGVEPIRIPLNEVSNPIETTKAKLAGNLNATEAIGKVTGTQIPTFDSLGSRIDMEMNFVKTGNNPNEFKYIATPTNNFSKSDSIQGVTFLPSLGVAQTIAKGAYTFEVTAGATGTVDIKVKAPDGTEIISKNISDTDQKVVLGDGTNEWFSVDYKAGSTGTTATFEVAEVGTVTFGPTGQIASMTGSSASGSPELSFTSYATGNQMTVAVDISELTGLATENSLQMTETDGFPAAVLKSYDIGQGGIVNGYYSDGSIQQIGQVAVATFANPAGLQAQGQNYFVESSNSGFANITAAGQGNAGQIVGQSLENSNVDIAKELTDLMFYQKAYTANSKNIQVSNEILNVAINLIR